MYAKQSGIRGLDLSADVSTGSFQARAISDKVISMDFDSQEGYIYWVEQRFVRIDLFRTKWWIFFVGYDATQSVFIMRSRTDDLMRVLDIGCGQKPDKTLVSSLAGQ